MKLILHHLWKDIRLQRWFLALWTLSLAVPVVFDFLVFSSNFDFAQQIVTLRSTALPTLISFMIWITTLARLFQIEPVIGTTSFWLTRPVPYSVYRTSKGLFILLLLFLPALVPIIAHGILFQLTSSEIAKSSAILLLLQTVAAILVIWLVTYSPSLLHFAGFFCLGILVFVVAMVINSALHGPLYSNAHSSFGPRTAYGPVDHFFPIALPGLLLSLVLQHVFRLTRAGFTVGIATLAIGCGAQVLLPGHFYDPMANSMSIPPGSWPELKFDPGWAKTISWTNRPDVIQAMAIFKPLDQQDGVQPSVLTLNSEFQAPSKSPTGLPQSSLNFYDAQIRFRSQAMIQPLLPGYTLQSDTPNFRFPTDPPPQSLFNLDPSSPLAGETGTLTVHLAGRFLRFTQEARIPLDHPDTLCRIHGGFIRLAPNNWRSENKLIVWSLSHRDNTGQNTDWYYVLTDTAHHTATFVHSNGNSASSGLNIFGGGEWSELSTVGIDGNIDPQHAELLVFSTEPTGDYFRTTLTAPDFTIKKK